MLAKLTVAIVAAFVLTLTAFPPTQAQQLAKMPKIGWLGPDPPLLALGSIDCDDIFGLWAISRAITSPSNIGRQTITSTGYLRSLMSSVKMKVDALVMPSSAETLAAKNATRTIPIICLNVGDPVALGWLRVSRGLAAILLGSPPFTDVLAGKRLELLKETAPQAVTGCGVVESTSSRF